MAHNLAVINGTVAMAYLGEAPWHRLGARMEEMESRNVRAALGAASLDWTVSVEPLFLASGARVPDAGAVVRGDAVLGTVSADYQPIQNADAFGMFQSVIDDHGLTIESAGALGRGERCWMLFKLQTTLEPTPGDKVNGYAVAVTSHNGHGSFHFRPTPIRVVCQNTLNAALSGKSSGVFSVAHFGSTGRRIDEARRIVGNLMSAMKATGDTFTSLARRRMTIAETRRYIETVFPAPSADINKATQDKREIVFDLVWSGVGADMAGSTTKDTTAWAVYNAVTEYVDHVKPALAKTTEAQQAASRGALFGTGDALKSFALTKARELVMA